MIKPAICFCIALTFFCSSCVPNRPELPDDQANKVRQHRVAPSEDIEDTNRTKLGSPLPPSANESTWKF